MKIQNLFFAAYFILFSTIASGQEYAIDKKASFVSLTGTFTSSGGELFHTSNDRALSVSFSPSVSHFVGKNFFIGGGFEMTDMSVGIDKQKSFGIGPFIGYAFGNSASTAFPYLDLGLRYYKVSSHTSSWSVSDAAGTDVFFDFGLLFPIKNHIGLTFEGGYNIINLKMLDYNHTSMSGNVFTLSVGFVALIF